MVESVMRQELTSWLKTECQGASVMRQEVSPCLPMNRKLWRDNYLSFVKEWGNKKVCCVEDFLNEYVLLAEAERATDEQLGELRNKVIARLRDAHLVESGFFIGGTIDSLLGELELLKQGKPSKWEIEFDEATAGADLINALENALLNTERAKTRMDKLTAIEKFASLTHGGGGPMLTHGCEIVGDELADMVVTDVLDCLTGEKK